MSNELKVTGGEWRGDRIGDSWLILNDSNECIETVYTSEANVHLLAASKRLYEALLLIEPDGDFTGWENKDGKDIGNKINAALAAARGEDQ